MPINPPRRRHKRWLHLPHDHGEPIARPRYDVVAGALAVFLGMFVWVGVPPQTHATVFDLPSPQFGLTLPPPELIEAIGGQPITRLSITQDGTPTINGEVGDHRTIQSRLRDGLNLPVEPLVLFEPHPDAAYGDSALLLAVIRSTGITKFCFAGLREHALTANEIRADSSSRFRRSERNEFYQRKDARVAQVHRELALCDEVVI